MIETTSLRMLSPNMSEYISKSTFTSLKIDSVVTGSVAEMMAPKK
jgi:hypothetical protein